MLFSREKKKNLHVNRLLITVNVLGSPGPIRFVVNEEALVTEVIDIALKTFARAGRLPVLGSDFSEFMLYPHDGTDALNPYETIGSNESRNFLLCKKPSQKVVRKHSTAEMPKMCGDWMFWLHKSKSLMVTSR